MVAPLHLPAVTSVRHLPMAEDLMVGLHPHLHMAGGARCLRMEVERHLTAEVAGGPCLCHRTVVGTLVADSVALATLAGSVGAAGTRPLVVVLTAAVVAEGTVAAGITEL